MKKKNLLFAGIMIFLLFAINQLAMAQIYATCSANKVLMSIGCACHCNSKCVNSNQVDQMLKKGWNLGGCTSFDCCPVLKNEVSNPSTTISLSFPNKEKVTIQIFNATEKLIKTFTEIEMQAGSKEISWDEKDENGNTVSPGVYFIQISANNYSETRKISIIK